MSLDYASVVSVVLLLLLFGSLVLTLNRVKQRLYERSSVRCVMVMLGNVMIYCLLAAALGNLSVKTAVNEDLLLVTDGQNKSREEPSVLAFQYPGLQKLTVHGYGLYGKQWQSFDDIEVKFNPPAVAAGPVSLNWQRQLLFGETLQLTGRWHTDSAKQIVTVKLLDPALDVVAQQRVKKGEAFVLEAAPKATGSLFYRLQAVDDNGQIISDDIVPSYVTKAPRAKIMVMQSTPMFETRHLKNWAQSQGAGMLLLTTISKSRTLTQAVNLSTTDSHSFSQSNLDGYDILIIDGRALLALNQEQQQWLHQAVEQGLGVLVLLDDALSKAPTWPTILQGLSVGKLDNALGDGLFLPGSEIKLNARPYPIGGEQAVEFEQDIDKRTVGVYKPMGLGKVALSRLSDRYRLRLNGQTDQYTRIWQKTFSKLARVRADSRFIAPLKDEISLPGLQSKVCVLSDDSQLQLTWKDLPVALLKDSLNPHRYCALFWPEAAGWQTFELKNAQAQVLDTLQTYTFDHTDWPAWQQHTRMMDTKAFITAQKGKPKGDKTPLQLSKPLDPLWYWLLFSFFASMLWWEQKHGKEQERI